MIDDPGLLSFALGMPATELFPAEAYARATAHVLETDPQALQYGLPFAPLKAHVVELMARRGVKVSPDQVFLTTGAQQAMSLLVRLLLDPGGRIVLEEAVYDGIHASAQPLLPRMVTVPTDLEDGIDVDAVEAALAEGDRPAFVYLIPEGQNPLGVTLSAEKRARLLELAARYGVPLIEDDVYGLLHYGEGPAQPAMRALDDRWVFYIGSFSKIMAPGLRVGWIVAPEGYGSLLSLLKHGTDMDVSSLTQRTISAFLDAGDLPGHLDRLRSAYRRRRDLLMAALREHFPADARWSEPTSGFYTWVSLSPETDTLEVLRTAVAAERVAFIPGQALSAGADARSCLRLCFATCPEHRIADGVAGIARAVAATPRAEPARAEA